MILLSSVEEVCRRLKRGTVQFKLNRFLVYGESMTHLLDFLEMLIFDCSEHNWLCVEVNIN